MWPSVAVCRHFKMRVLMLTALFACASAAPSGLLQPVVAYPAVTYGAVNSGDLQAALIDAKVQTEDYLRSVADKQREALEKAGATVVNTPVAYTAAVNAPVAYAAAVNTPVAYNAAVNAPVAYAAAVNTPVAYAAAVNTPVAFQTAVPAVAVNSGDFNAALIDAKVQTEDYLRSLTDKQREAIETAVVDTNEKVIEANDQVQEKAVENFWSEQDKKWQAVSAVQTAEAQLDGAIASTADAVAKSVVAPAIGPVVAPYSSIVYTPGVVALKEAIKGEKPAEGSAEIAAVKEAPKAEEKVEEAKSDSVQVESANVKSAEAEKSESGSSVTTETKYVVGQTPLLASFPVSPVRFAAQPYVVPSSFVPIGTQYVAPTVVKTVW